MRSLAFVIIVFFAISCGPSPYPLCSSAETGNQRCQGKADVDTGADGAFVAICDGTRWLRAMDCGEVTNSDGELLNEVCRETEGGPVCQAR